jgi:hypothetical protein
MSFAASINQSFDGKRLATKWPSVRLWQDFTHGVGILAPKSVNSDSEDAK